jgi:citrate lyase alpha subunit
MSIQLAEIVNAVHSYTNQKIVHKVKSVSPTTGAAINAGEKFIFAIEVTNATAANGGVHLVNVSYHIQTSQPSKMRLIVPPVSIGPATTAAINGTQLTPGQEVDHFFLHKGYAIAPGQTVLIDNLEGVAKAAGSGVSVGFALNFNIDGLTMRATGVATGQVAIL